MASTINQEPESLSVLSLFSGAGGLDQGLSAAGWTVLAQVEMDQDAAATLEKNHTGPGVAPLVVASRIEDVAPRALRRELGLRRGELKLLAGGPPCQPFTTSGRRRALHDVRATTLFPRYLEFVDEFRPRALLIENVDGMLSAALRHRPLTNRGSKSKPLRPDEAKGSFLRWLVLQLASRGFSVSWGVTEAAAYGVPQMRQRSILIGVRGREPCWLPEPTHGGPGQLPYRTVREALAGVDDLGAIQPLSDRKRAVYAKVPAGGNWRNLPVRLQKESMGAAYFAEGGRSGWWRRLAWDQPAPTVLGMPDHSSTALIHPSETRCLSVAECAALQSFPAASAFAGRPRSQYQQIGNAVPPLLGEAIGRQLRRFLEGERSDPPVAPEWRKASSNRRIGTHGWAVLAKGIVEFHLSVRVRADHIWAREVDGEVDGTTFRIRER